MSYIIDSTMQDSNDRNRNVEIFIQYPLYDDVNCNQRLYFLNVLPSEITVNAPTKGETSEVINLGEIVRLKKGGLHTVSWNGFLAFDNWGRYVKQYGNIPFTSQNEYINLFERLRLEMKPCRLIVAGRDINMMAVLSGFSWNYVGGTDDISYSISFTEFVPYDVFTIDSLVDNDNDEITLSNPENSLSPTSLCVGAKCRLNGTYYASSDGSGSYGMGSDKQVEISIINEGSSYPYHVKDSDGALGWCSASSLTLEG